MQQRDDVGALSLIEPHLGELEPKLGGPCGIFGGVGGKGCLGGVLSCKQVARGELALGLPVDRLRLYGRGWTGSPTA